MDDAQILDLYFERSERAIEETERKYGGYCFTLANAILNNRQDSEETVSDTYLKAWNAIPPQRPSVFKLFLARITRNLALSRWREKTADKRGGGTMELVMNELQDCIAVTASAEDVVNAKELEHTIYAFISRLPVRDRNIFLRRYFFVEDTDVIAQRYHIRPSAVLNILSRTRKRLKDYLRQEGYVV